MAVKIGFSTRKNNWTSKIIRWFTRSKVSHVWLLFDDPIRGQVVMEAERGPGLEETPWEWFPKDEIVAMVDPIVPLDKAVETAKARLGEKYDVDGLFGMAFVMVGRWFHVKLRNPLHNSHELFCSEAVAMVLQDAGYPGMEGKDPTSMSPEDVYELVAGKQV